MNREDVKGVRFSMLIALKRVGSTPSGNSLWEFLCDCGAKTIKNLNMVKIRQTRSCGCLKLKRTHGLRRHPLYGTWFSMMGRCYSKTNSSFMNYGGRGIKVCQRWHDIKNFIDDIGEKKIGLSIDRIDVNGDYEPNNVRWADSKTQCGNMRKNLMLEHDGKRMCIAAWAREKNLNPATIYQRLKFGWTNDEAIGTPPIVKYRRKNAQ